MSYVIVTKRGANVNSCSFPAPTVIRGDSSITSTCCVGDQRADPELMKQLDARGGPMVAREAPMVGSLDGKKVHTVPYDIDAGYARLNEYQCGSENNEAYYTGLSVREVLQRLDALGYRMVGCAGDKPSIVWTLYKGSN